MLSIYIHIPFCSSICSYCDFPKTFYNSSYVSKYLDSLSKEIKSRYLGENVDSIFIGGGTPSALSISELKKLFDIIKIFKLNKDYEFTFESNIESMTDEKLSFLYLNGVNRLSFGVQSFNTKKLKYLNRKHTLDDIYSTISSAKKLGFNNINMDLIYGVSSETLNDISKEIDHFLELGITHISCYSLIIEDHTVLSINKEKNIDEDLEYEMYKLINKKLDTHGYKQYEISNYSIDNYQSIHNLNYWNNGSYYGFGLGSVSYLNNHRITNTRNIQKYLNDNYIEEDVLESVEVRIENTLILGLRKTDGINIKEFNKLYNKEIDKLFNISELLKDNKLLIENGNLKISKDYLYLSNEILINFLGR